MRRARSIWCMTSSYSKTCVFVRPHVNEKPKICTLESVFEKMRCRWLFPPDRTVDQTGGEKKNGSNKNGYLWTGPLLGPAKVRSMQCSAKPAVPAWLLGSRDFARTSQAKTRRAFFASILAISAHYHPGACNRLALQCIETRPVPGL